MFWVFQNLKEKKATRGSTVTVLDLKMSQPKASNINMSRMGNEKNSWTKLKEKPKKNPRKTQEKLKKNPSTIQESFNNTPSKNDQQTHFFTIFLFTNLSKLLQTDQRRSETIENTWNSSKKNKNDQENRKRSKVIKKIEKRSKIFKIFILQGCEPGQFKIILDHFWNF